MTATGLGATVLALAYIPPDRGLLVELTSQKAASALTDRFGLRGAPLDLDVRGPPECQRSVRSSLMRAASADRGGGSRRILVTCRVTESTVQLDGVEGDHRVSAVHRIPQWWSVLPPILAIFIALGTRRLLLGLALSVWLGALLHRGLDITLGLWPAVSEFLWPSVSEDFRLSIVIFTSALVGMVNVTTRSGGTPGVALLIARLARGARSTRLATFLLGLAIFFDDYASCIIVGSTMRPLTDRARISREKLAYLVDSTSAPIAGLAILSTWIGYEVSLFDDIARELSLGMGGYGIFLSVVPSRFYCVLTLVFILATTLMCRDFGPMLAAERRAMTQGKLLADDAKPLTSRSLARIQPAEGVRPWWPAAVVPVVTVIVVTVAGLVWDGAVALGSDATTASGLFELLRRCLQEADGSLVLMLASLSGSIVAFTFALSRRREDGAIGTGRSTTPAEIVVLMALPLGLALLVALMKTGLWIQGDPFWTGPFWRSFIDAHHTRVILAGGILCSGLLGLACWSRRATEQRGVSPGIPALEVVTTWLAGARAMALAIAILVLAWCIQAVCQALDSSVYLVAALSGLLVPASLPVLVFLLAAAVSFATGTSWGTMGILIPTVLPLAHHFGGLPLLLLSAGAVLDGAIFGDHCSPISDTTVISSVASSCDHLHHVRTQLPYALTCMGGAAVAYLLATSGLHLAGAYAVSLLLLLGVIRMVGKKTE